MVYDGIVHDDKRPDDLNREKVNAIPRGISLDELRAFHESRMKEFGERLASPAIHESHEVIRPEDFQGAMILVQLEPYSDDEGDVLRLRDLLMLMQRELDRRAKTEASRAESDSRRSGDLERQDRTAQQLKGRKQMRCEYNFRQPQLEFAKRKFCLRTTTGERRIEELGSYYITDNGRPHPSGHIRVI